MRRCKFRQFFIDQPIQIDPVIMFGIHGYFRPDWMPYEVAWAIAAFRKDLTDSQSGRKSRILSDATGWWGQQPKAN